MTIKENILFSVREFLNVGRPTNTDTASIAMEISESEKFISAHIELRDCNRSISFDFDVWSADTLPSTNGDTMEADINNGLAKLQIFRRLFAEFEYEYLGATSRLRERAKKQAKKKRVGKQPSHPLDH
jgi:hypothetical protein